MKARALLLCAALLLGAAPAAGAVAVQQADPSVGLIGTEVLLEGGLDREPSTQNGIAALVAQSILLTPAQNGLSLQDAVKAGGGSVWFSIEPRRVRFYLEATDTSYAALQGMFAAALAHPDFSAATIAAARAALNAKIAGDGQLALRVGMEMLNRAFYQNSQAGMPRYGLPETLADLTGADAQQFYAAHYRRGDAVVSSAGNLSAVSLAPADIVAGLPPGTSPALQVLAVPASSTSRQIVARRDITVPWLVAQYRAPAVGSKDFGAMLILTQFVQRTLSEVSEVPGIASRPASQSGVGAIYNFESSPANVVVYVDGGLGDPVRTFSMALGVVNVLGRAKLGGDLTEMKNYALGRILEGSQTLQERAYLGAVFATHGGNYQAQLTKAINSTTAADLQRVAARYLGAPTIALVLPRSQ